MKFRSANGWLTDEALTRGYVEQYAVVRSYGHVLIELRLLDTGQYLVTETIRAHSMTTPDTTVDHLFDKKGRARILFRKLTKKHP